MTQDNTSNVAASVRRASDGFLASSPLLRFEFHASCFGFTSPSELPVPTQGSLNLFPCNKLQRSPFRRHTVTAIYSPVLWAGAPTRGMLNFFTPTCRGGPVKVLQYPWHGHPARVLWYSVFSPFHPTTCRGVALAKTDTPLCHLERSRDNM